MSGRDNNLGKLELDAYPPGYNARAVAYVWAYVEGLRPAQMVTLLAIAQHVNDKTGNARVGQSKLIDLTGQKETALKQSLKVLYAKRLLVKWAKKGHFAESVYSLPCLDYLPAPTADPSEVHAQEMEAGAAILSRPKGKRFGGSESDPILSKDTRRSDHKK